MNSLRIFLKALWRWLYNRRLAPHKFRTESTLESNNTKSKFHVGQKVRVVAGTKDPDYGFSIGGWSGSIEEIILSEDGSGVWLYGIQWNSNTLKAMGRTLHKKCEKDNLDITRMTLSEYELESE